MEEGEKAEAALVLTGKVGLPKVPVDVPAVILEEDSEMLKKYLQPHMKRFWASAIGGCEELVLKKMKEYKADDNVFAMRLKMNRQAKELEQANLQVEKLKEENAKLREFGVKQKDIRVSLSKKVLDWTHRARKKFSGLQVKARSNVVLHDNLSKPNKSGKAKVGKEPKKRS